MNELMIAVGNSYIYFKTNKTAVYDAMVEFENNMMSIGVNIDNMFWDTAVLRDVNGSDIGYMKW